MLVKLLVLVVSLLSSPRSPRLEVEAKGSPPGAPTAPATALGPANRRAAALANQGSTATPAAAPASRPEATPGDDQPLSADEVVRRVQGFYDKTAHLAATFRQVYTIKDFGDRRISSGRVWIKKPGKMRWDYLSKKGKVNRSFISDGSTLWVVEHVNKQVHKKNLRDDMLPVAIAFLYGQGDLRRDFVAELESPSTLGSKGDYVLVLKPKRPSARYKVLRLVADPHDFRVKQSVVTEASGNTNHFRFLEADTKTPVKDEWFVFNERKYRRTYRIIDADRRRPPVPLPH